MCGYIERFLATAVLYGLLLFVLPLIFAYESLFLVCFGETALFGRFCFVCFCLVVVSFVFCIFCIFLYFVVFLVFFYLFLIFFFILFFFSFAL